MNANKATYQGEQDTDVTLGGGGGGGAPTDAQYLVLSLDGTLTNERRLVIAAPLTAVDAGAGSTYTLDFDETAALGNNARVAVAVNGSLKGTRRQINLIEGSGVTITMADNAGSERVDVTISSSTTTAPNNAEYLVKTANATLSAERVVVDSTSITADWSTSSQVQFQRAALTGDVTASLNSNTLTIAAGAVTLAKMENRTASTLIGRGQGSGAGVPQEIILGSGLFMSGTTLTATGTGGTVTSVGLSMPGIFSVSGSPVTGSGTLTVTLANETANTLFAGPTSGGASGPTFRAMVTADIPNQGVTYPKIQNVSATSRVLARVTAGAGSVEEATASQVFDFIGSTRGSLLYRGATGWAALTPGSIGNVLTANGAGADPAWAAPSASDIIKLVQLFDETNNLMILSGSSYLQRTLAANKTYTFEFHVIWRSASTGCGIAFAIEGPTSPSVLVYNVRTTLTATTTFERWETAYNVVNPSASIDSANTDRHAIIKGIIKTGADVSVLFALRFASEDGSLVTLRAGSTCELHLMD